MDKKAGEMQGMSELPDTIDLNNEKHVELMLQEFDKRIADMREKRKELKERVDSAKSIAVPTAGAFFSLAGLLHHLHLETLEMQKSYFVGFVDLNKRVKGSIEKLMKEIEYVSEKTHVDLSEMKTQVAQIKEATEAPIYDYVKKQEANEREREKLEAELLDWAIRSH